MKKYFSHEVIIGIITIFSLVLLYFGINYLKGVNLFKPTNHYYIKFNDVTDLQKASPVYVNGFRIGVVNDIDYNYDCPGNIVALISLDRDMKIQTGSHVELTSSLTAGASLHIMLNTDVSSYYQIGDTLEGRLRIGPMDVISKSLVPQINDLIPKVDSILTGLQEIVNHPALTQSLAAIQHTTASLESSTASLNRMLNGDVPVILNNFKTVSSDFTTVSSELKSLDLTTAYNSLNATLKNIENMSNQMNRKDNSFGLLLNDRTLYDNLNTTTENASNLLLDLKQNPKRYVHFSVFSKSNK